MCIGRGPAYDADDHGYKSNAIIAGKQFEKAKDLWQGNSSLLEGELSKSSLQTASGTPHHLPCRNEGAMKEKPLSMLAIQKPILITLAICEQHPAARPGSQKRWLTRLA